MSTFFFLGKSPNYYFDYKSIQEEASQNRWGGNTPAQYRKL